MAVFKFSIFFVSIFSFFQIGLLIGQVQLSNKDDFEMKIPSSLSIIEKIKLYNDEAFSLNIDQAKLIFYYTNKALDSLEIVYDPDELARAYYQLARVYFYLSSFDNSLEKAILAKKKTKNKKILRLIYELIAKIYENQKQYDKVLKTYEEFEKIVIDESQKIYILIEKGRIAMNLKKFDYALHMFEESLELSKMQKSPFEVLGYIGLGNLAEKKNDKSYALTLFQQALIFAESSNISENILEAYFALGNFFHRLKNDTESNFYMQKALILSKSQNFTSLNSEIYTVLYKNFLAQNESTQALEMLRLQQEHELNLLKKRQSRREDFFEDHIEIGNLKREIRFLKSQKKHREIVIIVMAIFICTLVILLFLTKLEKLLFKLKKLRQ